MAYIPVKIGVVENGICNIANPGLTFTLDGPTTLGEARMRINTGNKPIHCMNIYFFRKPYDDEIFEMGATLSSDIYILAFAFDQKNKLGKFLMMSPIPVVYEGPLTMPSYEVKPGSTAFSCKELVLKNNRFFTGVFCPEKFAVFVRYSSYQFVQLRDTDVLPIGCDYIYLKYRGVEKKKLAYVEKSEMKKQKI